MAGAEPELFIDGACGRSLPAGELLQEFRFGQFCPVKLVIGDRELPVEVGKKLDSGGGKKGAGATGGGARADGTLSLAGQERISLGELLGLKAAEASSFTSDSRSSPAVDTGLASLMNTRGRMDGGNGGGREVLIKVSHWVDEADLASYLVGPWALSGATRIMFAMTPAQATALAQDGEVGVVYEDYEITVHLKKTQPSAGGALNASVATVEGAPGRVAAGPTMTIEPSKGTVTNNSYSPTRLLSPPDLSGVILALYFEWKQSWTLEGFSRGRLLQSLALAPQEEVTIELFTWDRRKKTLEQSSSTDSEMSAEEEEKTQDSTEVLRELTKKEEFELKGGGSVDIQYNPGPVKIKIGANVDARDKTNADSVARTTTKAIREGVRKSSARVKVQRSTKVTETTESGSEQRITRKVRNPNMCHTLNLDYFEILTHYKIRTEFNEDAMRFCAMIPNPVAEHAFSEQFIRQHEAALRDALLDRGLSPGFEAIRFLRAREIEQAEIAVRRQDRKDPLPAAPNDSPTPQTGISDEERAANGYLANLQATARKLLDEGNATKLDTALTCLGEDVPTLGTKKGQVLPHDLDAGKRWLAQQLLLRSFSQLTLTLTELAAEKTPPQIREWGPRLAAVMPEATAMPKPSQLNLEPQEVKQGLLRPAMWGPHGPYHVKQAADWGWWWTEILRVGLLEAEDAGLGTQIEQFTKVYRAFLDGVKSGGISADTKKLIQEQQKNQNQQNDEDRIENDFPIRDYALAKERAEVLELHLQEHAEHYSFALFLALPPQEQLDHIEQSMAGLLTSFEPGFFQPRVVSQIGSKLLVPLNHEVIQSGQEFLDDFKTAIDVTAGEDTMQLPSPGLTIEARLGRCSACEDFIEESRRLDIELRTAQVRQATAEAKRLEARLAAQPPRLEDPHEPVPRLSVDIQRPTQA
ncbi:hypothetical protein [Arthrobacter oryzae]|uniref:hypothetical protein n=1 Tax=Arthrobacter oryzae TaxID=409290 RepID=UPI00277F6A73|nr:hypothetical protein [Arthrobacter oryzae]MDQ0078565.1 hypothetical protein [Arthrobacter oryzae]